MGSETTEWYNTQILVGFTNQRGTAWHYKKETQGEESNHYPEAIPVSDVHRRLFAWEAIHKPVYYETANGEIRIADNKKAVIRNDNDHLLGIFSDGYQSHQYGEWLVKGLDLMLSGDLQIGSAGLLKAGAVAWVQIEQPESIEVLEGFKIRPTLLATTSHNGSIATTYKKVTTFVVCDNTYAVALGEDGEKFGIRHSRFSQLRIQNARDALGFVHRMGDDMTKHIRELSRITVSDMQFERILNTLAPVPVSDSKMSISRADNKREKIMELYRTDQRVAQWKGTGLAVMQAFNTYNQHEAGTDRNRVERNMMNTLMGSIAETDKKVLSLLGVR